MIDPIKSYTARLADITAAESARVAEVLDRGAVPDVFGDAIPAAPARGVVQAVDLMAAYPRADGGSELKPAGFAGRKTMIRSDVFDIMRAQSLRKGGRLPLTPEQVGMGRLYRNLVERREAGAVRCVSLEGRSGGGSGSRDGFTDARLDASRRIDMLQDRIGSGVALQVRRVRPSDRAGAVKRGLISNRALVDAVCLEGLDVSAVLARYGWSVKGDTRRAAFAALATCLQCMIDGRAADGTPQHRRTDITAIHYGPRPQWHPHE